MLHRAVGALALMLLGWGAAGCGMDHEVWLLSRTFAATPPPTSQHILVDQFGYRPDDPKFAVLVDPQQGFNAAESYTAASTYEVRRFSDGQVVFSGPAKAWNSGATQSTSGDRGWWFDFSAVTTPGSYYVHDPDAGVRSHRFEINEHVYRDVLRAATRMFFYNRCGAAKKPPHTDPRWEDDAAYIGPGQDTEARSVTAKDDPQTALDLRGGWFDAGDTNKYVTFAAGPVHQLLSAYEENPAPFTDDFDILESGNGIPDLLDEVRWEIDWMRRMQRDDGGVLIKVGTIDHNAPTPPSQDQRPRYYAPRCSSSSIVAAGVFAHAALVFDRIPALQGSVAELRQSAIKAWQWYHANPKRSDCDTQEIKAGDADMSLDDQEEAAVVAAVYLFALTGDAAYDAVVRSDYSKTRPYEDNAWSRYEPEQGDALLYYTTLPNADPATKQAIVDKKRQEAAAVSDIYGMAALELDLYRAYITEATYHWGSHRPRADTGNTNYDMIVHQLDSGNAAAYRARALGMLHYMHGVNPLGLVYLSNMYSYGAEASVNEIFHQWFAHGSDWDNAKTSPRGPAPGYVPGGPNKSYGGPQSPPKGEPPQKAYLDWNTGWPESSWEITEPAIYYQSSYVKLLSRFVPAPTASSSDGGVAGDGGTSDSRATDGGSTLADGGNVTDAGGTAGPRPDDGCACVTGARGAMTLHRAAPPSMLLWLLPLLLLFRRRPHS